MVKDVVAFVSLGYSCGPEMGDFGKFTVDLTKEELDAVYSVVKDASTKGYKRNVLAERFPEIDNKIRIAGRELVERISLMDVIINSRQYMDVKSLIKEDCDSGEFKPEDDREEMDFEILEAKWEFWEEYRIMKMESLKRFEFVKARYGLDEDATLDDICGELCYYLCREEIPQGYGIRLYVPNLI